MNRIRITLLFFANFFAFNCFGLVVTLIQHTKSQDFLIELWADDHFAGTREDNLKQLKLFVENVLPMEDVHLVIESKFFYGIDITSNNSEMCKKEIEAKYSCLGQDSSAPTWIGWDLPLILAKIFNDEQLPSTITLGPEQIARIKNGVTVDFIDPRLRLEASYYDLVVTAFVESDVLNRFESAAKMSLENGLEKRLNEYVSSRCKDFSLASRGFSRFDHLCDVEALTATIKTLYSGKPSPKKIIILSGTWHAHHLDSFFPALGFDMRKEFKLRASEKNVADKGKPFKRSL